MPASAVLGAVERTIPRDVVLSRIVLEATNYRLVLLGSGSFRVPQTYTITLGRRAEGPGSRSLGKVRSQILIEAPSGKQCGDWIRRPTTEMRRMLSLTCKAVLQAQANGNYFPLGVNRIDTEENL